MVGDTSKNRCPPWRQGLPARTVTERRVVVADQAVDTEFLAAEAVAGLVGIGDQLATDSDLCQQEYA